MAKSIILYSTGCPKCCVLAAKLGQKHIKYVTNGSEEEMKQLGIVYAPVLSVDGELMDFSAAVKWISEQ